MIAAAENSLAGARLKGSISFLITCDEEGRGVDGTKAVLTALAAEGEVSTLRGGCGDKQERVGDMIKKWPARQLKCRDHDDRQTRPRRLPGANVNPVTPLLRTCTH